MFDPTDLCEVTRTVVSVQHEGQVAKVVGLSCVFAASAEQLWESLTNPKKLESWFIKVSGELKEGACYEFKDNGSGRIYTCDPVVKIALSWDYGGESSWLTLGFEPRDGGTRLGLEHLSFVTDHWTEYGPSAAGIGWEMSFAGLARFLLGAERDEKWPFSSEAKEFYRKASRAWAEAAVADGEDKEIAFAAADRARAFYCGEED